MRLSFHLLFALLFFLLTLVLRGALAIVVGSYDIFASDADHVWSSANNATVEYPSMLPIPGKLDKKTNFNISLADDVLIYGSSLLFYENDVIINSSSVWVRQKGLKAQWFVLPPRLQFSSYRHQVLYAVGLQGAYRSVHSNCHFLFNCYQKWHTLNLSKMAKITLIKCPVILLEIFK